MVIVHVEVVCRSGSGLTRRDIRASVLDHLQYHTPNGFSTGPLSLEGSSELLRRAVESIFVELECMPGDTSQIPDIRVYLFTLNQLPPDEALLGTASENDEPVEAASVLSLPHLTLADAWQHLHYDPTVKRRLLDFALASVRLASTGVSPSVIGSNRLVLLSGPPGCGKTSLARALGHKLAIRLQDLYSAASLIEVNAHSLFSRWFSESGKLVSQMFSQIREMVQDGVFCVVLIDEVESLAMSRSSALAGGEPADSVRAVNALITQLDSLRAFPNVLVICTSNMAGCVDRAFLDRADIQLTIPPPSAEARTAILMDSAGELLSHGVLCGQCPAEALTEAVNSTEGASGRALARLPLLALASPALAARPYPIPLAEFVSELARAGVDLMSSQAESAAV